MTDVSALAERVREVRGRISAVGVDPDGIRLVAVTKGFPPAAVEAAQRCGLADVGESYAQELADKARAGGPGPRWHFLGQIQRNKVSVLAPWVDTWHSVDRLSEGEAIARRQPGARVMVQVAAGDEEARGGCPPADVSRLVEALGKLELDVIGLMGMARRSRPGEARRYFAEVRRLADGSGLTECSMGMTDDLEDAVAEGATMVRVGRGLFGPRPGRTPQARDQLEKEVSRGFDLA